MTSTVRALWQRRHLIRSLAISNLKTMHHNTALGYLWWLLDPILMTAVYTILLGFIRRGGQHQPYPAFAMCGLIFWKSVASTITQSITIISRGEGLIKSFSFPRAALPIAVFVSNQVLFLFALIPLLVLCLFYQFVMKVPAAQVGWTLLYAPLVFLVGATIILGASLIFSCFGVFFKDLANIMVHVLRVLWYLSPGLYAISDVLDGYHGLAGADWSRWQTLYVLNPFAHVMEAYRNAILFGRTPDLAGLALALGIGVAGVFLGLRVFQSQEKKFAKLV